MRRLTTTRSLARRGRPRSRRQPPTPGIHSDQDDSCDLYKDEADRRDSRRPISCDFQIRSRRVADGLPKARARGALALWRALTTVPFEPEASRPTFAEARRNSVQCGDLRGAYTSWCGEVSSYVLQWGAVQGLADLVYELERLHTELIEYAAGETTLRLADAREHPGCRRAPRRCRRKPFPRAGHEERASCASSWQCSWSHGTGRRARTGAPAPRVRPRAHRVAPREARQAGPRRTRKRLNRGGGGQVPSQSPRPSSEQAL